MLRELHIICGPNGAGKTTLIRTFAERRINEDFYIAPNPDDPNRPDLSSMEKQKVMLSFVYKCLEEGKSFIFETTGSGKNSVLRILKEGKIKGYTTTVWYLWLPSPDIAEKRVNFRYREGGHYVPRNEIQKRYDNGIENLSTFIRKADRAIIIDRSKGSSGRLVASKSKNCNLRVNNYKTWDVICSINKNLKNLEA